MDELLFRMLAASLRRNIHHASLEKLQKSLLHTLPGYVTRDGRIVTLPRNLVYLVYEYDSPLGPLEIVVSLLQKS